MPHFFAARLTRPRLLFAAAVLAVAGLLIAVAGQTGPAGAATGRAAHPSAASWNGGPKPIIVLVHGAWADSGSWNGVIWRLQAAGYTVYAPPNPLRGVSYDSTYLADFLSSSALVGQPVVLVGHSYGGFVITNAATGNPNVKALVYDDAYLPAQGDTLLGLTSAKPGSCLNPATSFNAAFYPDPPVTNDVDLYVKQSVFPGCFANGLPAAEGAVLAATQRPLAESVLGETLSGPPAWETIPSWDIIGTADHVLPPAEQLAMAQRAGASITEINAPHLSMITDPGVVAAVIIQAAQATS
jgi:pimeloyl-ACP methyl ester carboxylesterase